MRKALRVSTMTGRCFWFATLFNSAGGWGRKRPVSHLRLAGKIVDKIMN